jgi:hypothetical protein
MMPAIESKKAATSHKNMTFLLSGCIAGLRNAPSWYKIKGRETTKPESKDILMYAANTSVGAVNIKFSTMPVAGNLIIAEILLTNTKERITADTKNTRLIMMRLRNSSRCSIMVILLAVYMSFIINRIPLRG